MIQSGTKTKPINRSQLPKTSGTLIKIEDEISMREVSEMKQEEGQEGCERDAVENHDGNECVNSHRESRIESL